MKETLENRKRRTKTKVRKRNDCLNKEKKITEREREGGERMGHFYALSILVDRVNGGGVRFYVARGSSVRNNCTLKTFLENVILLIDLCLRLISCSFFACYIGECYRVRAIS